MRRRAVVALALCAALVVPASAQAIPAAKSKGLTYAGIAWHIKDSSGKLGQRWVPSNVVVSGGVLNIYVRNHSAGGVGTTTTFGPGHTFSATFRMSAGVGKYDILLWRRDGNHRPEYDLAEGSKTDPKRTFTRATYHPAPGCTRCIQDRVSGNFTQFHRVVGKWTKGSVVVTIDGKQLAKYPGFSGQLAFDIQTNQLTGSGTSVLQIKNVSIS